EKYPPVPRKLPIRLLIQNFTYKYVFFVTIYAFLAAPRRPEDTMEGFLAASSKADVHLFLTSSCVSSGLFNPFSQCCSERIVGTGGSTVATILFSEHLPRSPSKAIAFLCTPLENS